MQSWRGLIVTVGGFLILANVPAVRARGGTPSPNDRTLEVRNHGVVHKVPIPCAAAPPATLEPIRLVAVRNGTFAGQIVIADDTPIKGLKAKASDLKGPATLAASAVRVRYGLPDGFYNQYALKPTWYDSLEDDAPAEVRLEFDTTGRAVLPLWITVTVPADTAAAPAGTYTGSLAVTAEGVKPLSIPLELKVIDWTLPPVDQYVTAYDIIQSPETVAIAYDVPLWSEKHFQLLDRTFSLLGEMGAKTLYVTAIRRTHFGNEHAMVRWVRREDGELTPDFTIVEKYLDTAMKHIPHPRGVILYCWEPPESQGHAGQRPWDKPVLITVADPKTGKTSPAEGPSIGSAESKPFWKKLTDGLQAVLQKRGLEKTMLFGLVGDSRPTKVAMDDMANGMEGKDHWALHSHLFTSNWQGHDIGFVNALWGIGVQPIDPSKGYAFGWSNPLWLSYYPREMHVASTLVEHRVKLETWMGARKGSAFIAPGTGARGLGRLGGDFWKVAKNRQGRVRYTLAGIYPEAAWGQLNLNFCISHLLGQGSKGALPTVRSEALREGLQEVETRIYVEKAWLDPEARALLGDELMTRIRSVLDERIRSCMRWNAAGSGQPKVDSADWRARSETLFNLAAEIAKKLGREPKPNLAPRATLDGPAVLKPR